jgi:hypothetical protein
VNCAVPVAVVPPSVQRTVAVAGPGVLVEGFQVQDTVPSEPVVCAVLSALLPEAEPEA